MIWRVLILSLITGTLCAEVRVRDGRVSADLQSQPLMQVLERLKEQTNMKMVIDGGIAGKTVSASFQDLSVGLALKKILEGTGINYAVLAGPDGEAQSVFIGGSSPPGSPPRRLDNRPVQNRGVVTPVPAPPPPGQTQQPALVPVAPQQRQQAPPVNVPTGGGFVPQQPATEPMTEDEQQQEQQQLDNETPDE
jgi:hypothetical protein